MSKIKTVKMKAGSKTEKVTVIARFEVVFNCEIDADKLKQLDAGEIEIEDVIDESIAYDQLRDGGSCEMEIA